MTTGNLPDATVLALRHRARDLINNQRDVYTGVSLGHHVTMNANLVGTAQSWANHMAAIRTDSHSDLSGPARYYSACGENIGKGQTTADQIVREWRLSCSHFYIQNWKGYSQIGIGVARASNGVYFWCAHYGGSSSPGCGKCYGGCQSHTFFSNDPNRPGGA